MEMVMPVKELLIFYRIVREKVDFEVRYDRK